MSEEKERPSGDGERRRCLFFRSGGELFTIGIASITEIVVEGQFTPVPLAPRQVVGVINHRGRIFTVVSFAALAGLTGEERGEAAILLHRSDMSVGIAVAAIEGIQWVPRRLLDAVVPAADRGEEPFLKGVLDFQGQVAGVVDPDRLVGAIVGLPERAAAEDQRLASERRDAYGS